MQTQKSTPFKLHVFSIQTGASIPKAADQCLSQGNGDCRPFRYFPQKYPFPDCYTLAGQGKRIAI
jgi:hypothetical protein